MTQATPRRAITDSPWYWLYLFCTAALIALLLMGPKYQARQTQLERNFQGRERANQQAAGQTPDVPLTESGHTIIRLEPLYIGFAALLIVAWSILWWQHFYRPDKPFVESAEAAEGARRGRPESDSAGAQAPAAPAVSNPDRGSPNGAMTGDDRS